MNPTAAGFLYLLAAVLFIVGLKRLSSPATAKDGNRIAALGMLIAIVVTLLDEKSATGSSSPGSSSGERSVRSSRAGSR